MGRSGWMLPISALVLFSVAPAEAQQPARTAMDRVYSEAQASRGEDIYRSDCAACHGGGATLARAVIAEWADTPVFEPFEFIRTNMPMGGGGVRLTRNEYVDVVAYLLKAGGFPAGTTDLPMEADGLRAIRLVTPPRQ